MTTTPTTDPVPSSRPQDLLFNAGVLDQIVNGTGTVADRFGVQRQTLAAVLQTLAAYNVRGNWATGTAYALKDAAVQGGIAYVCLVPHTSGTFATDLAAGRWGVLQGVTPTDLASTASNKGAGLLGWLRSAIGAVATTVHAWMGWRVINALEFMTDAQRADVLARTAAVDVTAALQAAIDHALLTGRALRLPAGIYRTSASLQITDDIELQGDGSVRTIIKLHTAVTSTPAINIDIPNNSSFIGGRIGGIGIVCNGGSALGAGLNIQTTATNSAISNSTFCDLYIQNVTVGVGITGVVYMSTFRNITVTGQVTAFGWYCTSPQEIIYNTFADLEVTGVGSAAKAYFFQVLACQMRNLTADGCIYISNPYGHVQGITIEGISAPATPTNVAIELNQCQALSDVAIINVPASKCTVGIYVVGRAVTIRNVRFPWAGVGNQPGKPLEFAAGATGTLTAVYMDNCAVKLSHADLQGFVAFACDDITDFSLAYKSGTWTPTFPASWTTAPTVIAAQWQRVGRVWTISMLCSGGVCTANASIGGLPVAASATGAFAVGGSSSDSTDRLTGAISPGQTSITAIPAANMTGDTWQMSATYFG